MFIVFGGVVFYCWEVDGNFLSGLSMGDFGVIVGILIGLVEFIFNFRVIDVVDDFVECLFVVCVVNGEDLVRFGDEFLLDG